MLTSEPRILDVPIDRGVQLESRGVQLESRGPRVESRPPRFDQEFKIFGLFCLGMVPISFLAIHIFGIIPLRYSAPVALTVYVSLLANFVFSADKTNLVAIRGYLAGLCAVFIYDLARWSLSYKLGMADFIPAIGGWILGDDERHWALGYLWRFLGNGAGMGMAAYCLLWLIRARRLKVHSILFGVIFGIAIWTGLLATLVIAPRGEELMMKITPISFAVTLIGHLVYGSVLGVLFCRYHEIRRFLDELVHRLHDLESRVGSRTQPFVLLRRVKSRHGV